MIRLILLILYVISFSIKAYPQGINAYAKVDSIVNDTLYLSNVNEIFDTFEQGEKFMILQIQDDVIGGNINNDPTFGNLGSIAGVGKYGFNSIDSVLESSGTPNAIVVNSSLANTYNSSQTGNVQIISFPSFGNSDYTISSDIEALAWNGDIGGIIAFEVPGTLTLDANITANGKGFRGGAKSNDFYIQGATCNSTPYYSNSSNYGEKGESIFKNTNPLYSYARGRNLNGGGGGNRDINGGGGGGSNFSAGGEGGRGWLNTLPTGCQTPIGGFGGIPLKQFIYFDRIFLGGGGGGGQQNNTLATDGGNGGGIIYIKASQIVSSCTSGAYEISASGEDAQTAGNDGAGGGGGGGTIVLEVLNWNISNSCPITIQANGGNGGNVADPNFHAGGGGGGLGAVLFFSVEPTINITTNTIAGQGGQNCSSCNSAANGTGMNRDGIIDILKGVLSAPKLKFSVDLVNKGSQLNWEYPSFDNSFLCKVNRSSNGENWEEILDTLLNWKREELFLDSSPSPGNNYYYIQLKSESGIEYTSEIQHIIYSSSFKVFPNPSAGIIWLEGFSPDNPPRAITIFDTFGKKLICNYRLEGNKAKIDVRSLGIGFYFLEIQFYDMVYFRKIKIT